MARGTSTVDTNNKLSRTLDLPMPGGFTIMAWSRIAALSASLPGEIFSIGRAGGLSDWALYVDSNPPLVGGGILVVTSSGTVEYNFTTGTWTDLSNYHHFALVQYSPSATGGPILVGYMDGVRVGSWTTMTDGFPGDYDEVSAVGISQVEFPAAACFNQHFRFWNRPLSAAEVQREMRSRFAVARPGLVADLPLLFDNYDLVQRSAWTETGTFSTEVGPILGGFSNPEVLPFVAGAAQAAPIMLPGYYV